MSFLFGKTSAPKLPAVIPAQIPTSSPDSPEYNAKQALRGSGFENTILAGSLEPKTGKKSVLGNSA